MAEHLLVTIGKEKYNSSKSRKSPYPFLGNSAADAFLNDLENYPHAVVLAALMDKQIKAERAWAIPFEIYKILGAFDIDTLYNVSLAEYKKIFNDHALHRFNNDQAEVFYLAVHRIKDVYCGDVSIVWEGKPSSAKVVYEFLQFKGSGVKISTMLANILARDLHVEFSDYYSVDISPDVHIMKIMKRTGLVPKNADRDAVIYKARELCPEFPGIIDFSCWEIGREWCKKGHPLCSACPINKVCKKHTDIEE